MIQKNTFMTLAKESSKKLGLDSRESFLVLNRAEDWYDSENKNILVGTPIPSLVEEIISEIAADAGIV